MTYLEKMEIHRLPEKYKPLGAWGYFWYSVLFSIPVIGLIFLIVFSVNDSNINRRSFARSYFVALIAALVVAVVAIAVVAGLRFAGIPTDEMIAKITALLQ